MSRLFRIAAVLLVAMSLWPRGVSRHERVLVFALEGLDLSILRDAVAAGEMPVLKSVFEEGVRVGLHGWRVGDRSTHWRALFGGGGVADWPADLSQTEPVWDELVRAGGSALVVAVPGLEARDAPRERFLADVDPATGFDGDNVGWLVNGTTVLAGELDWPYAGAAADAARAAGRLKRGEWSDWIRLPIGPAEKRSGAFRLFRVDAERFYLTPVFVGGDDPRGWDQAAWALADSGFEQLQEAASDAARAKFESAVQVAGPQWDLTVYFDTSAANATRTHERLVALQARDAPGRRRTPEESATAVRESYREVDRQLGELRAKAGDRTCVVVLLEGRDAYDGPGGVSRNRAELVVACDSGRRGRSEADFVEVAPTLRYLLALPADTGKVIAPVAARCWTTRGVKRSRVAGRMATPRSRVGRSFDADALVELGTVPQTAETP